MSRPLLERRWPWITAGVVIVLAFLSTTVHIPSGSDWDSRPLGSVEDIAALRQRSDLNVLFVLIDTLRADRLGSYGYERDTSPALDQLAASGVRFAHHLAQSSWTKASMASLWTGLYPRRNGITRFDQVLPDAARMPAEILREAGFATVGLYRNGWVAATFGFDQGFEVYEKPLGGVIPPGVRRQKPTLSDASTDESVVRATLEFLRLRGRERWLLYLHLMDVHEYTYDEESALFGARFSDIYDNAIRRTDSVLEVLFSSLADLGQLERTLVVVAADHGEAFGERGFEGHGRKVYREETEVPLFLFFPFRLERGVVVETRTQNVDIWPTVLDLLGLRMGDTDGRSRRAEILAIARGEAPSNSGGPAIAHLDQTWGRSNEEPSNTVAVADGSWRYVRVEQEPETVEQLFNAEGDPGELRDRARDDPDTLKHLRAVADAYLENKRPDWGAPPTREVGELELGHLRALGYAVP